MSANPEPLRVAALGYYGFRNLGDEAVLAGIRRALADQFGAGLDLLVLSNSPEDTCRFHAGVRSVDRWSWRAVSFALRGTDLFILGGGSLLQDTTSARSVLWYALMATLARRRARRVLWWGQGIGPLHGGTARRLVRWIARQADAITVRDSESATLLKRIGVRDVIEVVADPAFALDPKPDAGDDRRFGCLLALRPWKTDAIAGVSSRLFQETMTRYASPAALLPMHVPADRVFVETLPGYDASEIQMLDWSAAGATVGTALGWVSRAECVVAMRLHALIFAARCGTPFVALSYDPKVDALARESRQEDVLVPVESFPGDRLFETLHHVRSNAPRRRDQLRDFATDQKRRARRPAEIAAGLLT
jgi:polysaccharide pyruvyl transferase CsaB